MGYKKLEERRKIAESEIPRFIEFLREIRELEGEKLEEHLSKLREFYVKRKRDWVNKNKNKLLPKPGENLIDCAMRVLYRLNLYLPEGYINVVEKTENRLVSEFRDKCPILDACQYLGLDTRLVCRRIFHDPYQALLSEISPKLKFNRDYENGLRPYSDRCIEIITVE